MVRKKKVGLSVEISETPEELTIAYFDENPQTFSRGIFERLTPSPFFSAAIKDSSKPTTKEILMVASVVIAASDKRIDELEEEKAGLKKDASKIRAILGSPIWAVRQLSPEVSLQAERQWISRYMTLGNVLGAIVVILGILGGVLTYFTRN